MNNIFSSINQGKIVSNAFERVILFAGENCKTVEKIDEINNINKWHKLNLLLLNISKSKLMTST